MRLKHISPIALAIVFLSGCWPEDELEGATANSIRSVRTQLVELTDPVSIRQFPAVLQPAQITPLAFDVGGRLGPIDLQIGQEVQAGAILATVEGQEANLRLQQAESALAEASLNFRTLSEDAARQTQLFDRGIASAAARDRAVSAADQAQARVDQQTQALELLRESVSDTSLRAPFDGFVNSIEVQNYGTVSPGQPIVTLYQDTGLTATILVTYEIASSLVLGQPVSILPSNGYPEPLTASVAEIARRAPAVSSFPVVIALDEVHLDLRPGMAVDVNIAQDLPSILHGIPIPLSALATQRPADLGGAENRTADIFVFVENTGDTGTVEPRTVTISAVVDNLLIVTDGIVAGERIVTAGVPFLHAGQDVKLEPTAESFVAEVNQ